MAPPSKPQNLKVTSQYYGYESLLTWEANIEPDMINGGKYKIYRSESSESNFYLIATINAYVNGQPVTSFVDEEVGPSRFNKLYYRITAFDNTNKKSVPSDFDWRFGRVPKESLPNNELELNYRLLSNYPNPFNPNTVIHFSVKDAGLVSLKVFDILGREVAVLVNDIKEAGNHSVEFNASNLPSGVYLYTIQVNGYANSKKMLLVK